jgi:hypothetical protein
VSEKATRGDLLKTERAIQEPGSGFSTRALLGFSPPAEWGPPPSAEKKELRAWIEEKLAEGRARAERGDRPAWLAEKR